MKLRKLALAAAVFVGLSGMTGAAFAQSKVFYINEARVRQESKVGKEMNATLRGLANQDAEKLGIKALNDQVAAESKALEPQLQSLTEEALKSNATLNARIEALKQKDYELQQKSGLVSQNLSQRSSQLNQMFTLVLDPAIVHVAKQSGADVVLADPSARYIKESSDLTSKVIARLDATIPTLAAMQAALQPPAAPAPAAPAAPKPQ